MQRAITELPDAQPVPVGPYRLLYRMDDETLRVYIVHVEHRADVSRPR